MNFKILIGLILVTVSLLIPSPLKGDDIIYIEPLFEYPVAPEELESLSEKSDYLVKHFWDNYDFKKKDAVDQNALNDAFYVYVAPMKWANEKIINQSIDNLINKISKNPGTLLQFTKAAEENLYSQRSEIWNDDIYLRFVTALIKNNKVPEKRRNYYKRQKEIIENNIYGGNARQFDFTDKKGNIHNYFPMSTPTLIIFADPSDLDWRMERMKLENNLSLNQALDKGQINIIFISWNDNPDALALTDSYNSKWMIGLNKDIKELIDIRIEPSYYIIGKEGKIIIKNTTVDNALTTLLSSINS